MQRLRLKADGRIVELRDGQEFPLAPAMPAVAPADAGSGSGRARSAPARAADPDRIRRPARRARRDHPQLGAGQAHAARTGARASRRDRACAGNGVCRARPTEPARDLAAGQLAALLRRDIMGSMVESQPMQFVEANGARIPAIGLGTWELRGRTCARLVEQALRLGYRHIDTAQIYENEREVGEGLRASGVSRDEVFVTTKVWTTHFAPNDLERSDQGEPGKAASAAGRSVAAALAQSARAAAGDAGRAGACQAARPGPAHRRVEFHRGADRGGGRGLSGAAGVRSGRISSLSRPDQGAGGLRAPRHGAGRLQPDRQGPHQERRDAGADRARPTARPPRRSACAGWCSRMSPRSRAPRGSSGCRKISTSSISSCPTTRCARFPRWAAPRAA